MGATELGGWLGTAEGVGVAWVGADDAVGASVGHGDAGGSVGATDEHEASTAASATAVTSSRARPVPREMDVLTKVETRHVPTA